MEEIILADFCDKNKDVIDTLIHSGIISNQLVAQKQIFKRFNELKVAYPSVLDRYEILAEDYKLSTAVVRKYVYKMKRRIRIKEIANKSLT